MLKSLKTAVFGVLALGLMSGLMVGIAGTAKAEVITLKLHHLLPPVSSAHKNMLVPWANKVMKDSGGRLKIDIYPSMQLGGAPPQLAGQARDGIVDIVWTLPGYTPGLFTRTEVFELPFMHSSTVATTLAINEFADNHPEDFKAYKIIAMHVHAGQLFHSRKPIRTVADIKGTKIRTPTRTGAWLIEAMGAVPIGAPVPKIPELLSKGIVDSVLVPFEIVGPLKLDQLVNYHIVLDDPKTTRINTTTFMIAMNKKKYDSLPADLRKVIDNNSGKHIAKWIGEIWDAAEKPGMAKAAASGEIFKLPPAEVAKLRAMTEGPVTERWIKDVSSKGIDGVALVKEARALIAKYSK
ncbi:MAG: TRAP transporter substrate-binding protein [Proteobacteria bacterium]|nr:TRAP transporter substrate-binding protein [Pseudomonadota bacterium]